MTNADSPSTIRVDDVKRFMDKMSVFMDQCFYIVNFVEEKVVYRTPQSLIYDKLLDQKELFNHFLPYRQMLNEMDGKHIDAYIDKYKALVLGFSYEERTNHFLVQHFAVRYNDIDYVFCQKFLPLSFDDDGLLLYGAFYLSPAPKREVKTVMVYNQDFCFIYNYKKGSFIKQDRRPELSEQEQMFLYLIHRGYSVKETANLMGIHENTAYTYQKRIISKLAVSNMLEAIQLCRNYGICRMMPK